MSRFFSSGIGTGIGLVSAIVCGLLLPSAEILRPAIPFLLGILLFSSFIRMDFWRNPRSLLNRGLLIFPVAVWGILPPLVLYLGRHLEPGLQAGLFVVLIAPPALGAPVIVEILRGDRRVIVSNTVVFNLLSPFAYTILFAIWFQGPAAGSVRVPVWEILKNMLFLIFLPLGAALVTGFFPVWKRRAVTAVPFLGPAGLILVVFTACASASRKLRELPSGVILSVLGIVMALCLSLYGLGFLFGRTPEKRRALAVGLGQKNSSLAVWIGMMAFGPLAAVPPVIYILCHHLVNAAMILFIAGSRRKTGADS